MTIWAEDRLGGWSPRNTLSNLAYPLVGCGLYRTDPRFATLAFWTLLTVLGVGSGLYHALKTPWAQTLDHAGMFGVFAGLTTYVLAPTHPLIGAAMGLAAAAAVAVLNYLIAEPTDSYMGVWVAAALIRGFLLGTVWLTGLALALFGLAYWLWHLDRRPDPPTRVYGHACWHVLTAVAIGVLYRAQGVP